MDRRTIFQSAIAAVAGVFAAKTATPALAQTQSDGLHKAVYHLSDLDKVAFVLGNIRNHIDGVGGADKARIAVVVHGPALRAFHKAGAFADTVARTDGFNKAGVRFEACVHTMASQNVKIADLLTGFAIAEKGGVVRIAQLQHEGWAYLRP